MVGIHIVCWIFMFLSPLMFANRAGGFDWSEFAHGVIMPTTLCIAFYANYLYLTPRLLIKEKKHNEFFIINALMIAGIVLFLHFFMGALPPPHKMPNREMPPSELL